MAYMNFNTDTKFWKHLQVEGIDPSTNPDASGYVAYNTSTNNGIISIAEKSAYSWKPIIHEVVKGNNVSGGSVTTQGGIVTVCFPDSSGGSSSIKTFVSNIDVTSVASTEVTSFGVALPGIVYNANTDYITAVVYAVDAHNNITGIAEPQMSIGTRSINEMDECYITFDFKDHTSLITSTYYKVCILYDGSAQTVNSGIWNIVSTDLTLSNTTVTRTTMTNKNIGN